MMRNQISDGLFVFTCEVGFKSSSEIDRSKRFEDEEESLRFLRWKAEVWIYQRKK